ncbi:hypothetical protein AtubIFM55763_007478 [Aspergillus tubingensis]|uniref:Alpha/beta superfamily hydrolase n=1 Tax=Aspergillus niger TaxID=5061 RepID=A0A100IG94_ASPNG|nr:alpha/beta superfamily hydrolase [Aspergillus niger]GLA56366.1 hypothetical protein AtubIFM54640_000015 [Aspergillus tubingensis]GLA75919.1 hypothetical protein AtubIFM55763_007478 [Aspergillus tubingensis]GLA93600.1 hypothetical protein AtubIFM57143_011197 [Aspergillus tubingensis]
MKLPALLLAPILHTICTTAQNLSYGADNFYRSNLVTLQPVTFPTQYQTLIAGNLFIPNNLTTSTPSPAIIVGHPMGAVKEQSANLYATKMAERGYITLSIDLPFWGSSTGTPRNAVSPDLYAEAFSAAVDYLGSNTTTITTIPSIPHPITINRNRIGVIGICASGGFALSAAKIDPRIKAIVTASMYDMGTVNRQGLRHSQNLTQRQEVIASAALQRWPEYEHPGGATNPIGYTSGTPNTLTANASSVDREFYDFYRTVRGEFTPLGSTPELTTHPTVTSNLKFMNFYPLEDLDVIAPRPVLFISGDRAHSREFSENAYRGASEPKELLWVPGAGHVDLYDRVELIPWERIEGFFGRNL